MATWCIEAAKSLRLKSHRVTISVSPGLEYLVPNDIDFFTVDAFSGTGRNTGEKITDKIIQLVTWFWPKPGHLTAGKKIISRAAELNIPVDIVLWNQTNLLVANDGVKQWVAGWAYPVSLFGYLKKLSTPGSQHYLARVNQLIYWYRTDNSAYKNADGVLAVTEALSKKLRQKGINVLHAAPGCLNMYSGALPPHQGKPRLLIMALGLEEARKRIGWMIKRLSEISGDVPFELTLIGNAGDRFKNQAKAVIPGARFTGTLTRSEIMKELKNSDILLFGSIYDDWGFVQVEAMASGICVFAPAQLPSTEIIPLPAFLFKPKHPDDFQNKLRAILKNPSAIASAKNIFLNTYNKKFSGMVFAETLMKTALNTSLVAAEN